jgi:hypothetical protein
MSSCPICKSKDGFPQTIQREKVSGNMYVVTSYSQSIQYVFCKECRVQFEPLVTWADFNASIRNAEIARVRAKEREQRDKELEKERLRIASLSPAERVLHDSPLIMKSIKTRFRLLRLFFVAIAIGIAYLWSDYPQFADLSTALKILISMCYLVLVVYVLKAIGKRQSSKMSDVLEDENRARKETGFIYPRP